MHFLHSGSGNIKTLSPVEKNRESYANSGETWNTVNTIGNWLEQMPSICCRGAGAWYLKLIIISLWGKKKFNFNINRPAGLKRKEFRYLQLVALRFKDKR